MPVLGLSNKAVQVGEHHRQASADGAGAEDLEEPALPAPQTAILDLAHPPFEDHLARHTLWPEREKLYGHGYEISAVAASHEGDLVATACRASSVDHAVIRIYDTRDWREIKPPLAAHTLSVTRLEFSRDDRYLLSVGRDRQFAIFERVPHDRSIWKHRFSEVKAHRRMILDCSWAPIGDDGKSYHFATASRDKQVR
jgi:elongator complex protein 2